MRQMIPVRRPIAARRSRWAQVASRALIRVGLTPNQVSVLSVFCATGAGLALATSAEVEGGWRIGLLLTAAVGIQARLLCNLLDGLMAEEGGLRSVTGELYNDVPDRFADAIILISAGCAARSLEFGMTLGWLAGLMAVITAYVRVLGAAVGAGHDFRGPMAKQQRMAIVTFAALASMFDPLWRGEGQILRAALAVITLGGVVTIAQRLLNIAATLRASKEHTP